MRMVTIVLFSVFVCLIYVLVAGAFGFYLISTRGYRGWIGFLVGFGVPGLGLIILGLLPVTKKSVLNEAYAARFISQSDYEKTRHDLDIAELSNKRKARKV